MNLINSLYKIFEYLATMVVQGYIHNFIESQALNQLCTQPTHHIKEIAIV